MAKPQNNARRLAVVVLSLRCVLFLPRAAVAFRAAGPGATPRGLARPRAAPSDDVPQPPPEVEVFSKKQAVEERYPYEVYETSPPQSILGVFALSPTVGCGDVLRIDGNKAFVIKRVASRYKYANGRFNLLSKRADATEVNRAAAERKLARLMAVEPPSPH